MGARRVYRKSDLDAGFERPLKAGFRELCHWEILALWLFAWIFVMVSPNVMNMSGSYGVDRRSASTTVKTRKGATYQWVGCGSRSEATRVLSIRVDRQVVNDGPAPYGLVTGPRKQ